MQYLYHSEAGALQLQLSGDSHRYLFKVRREREGETIYLRNLDDQKLYSYYIEHIDKKIALLRKSDEIELRIEAKQKFHIGWCIIDPKSIEKVLPTLNETGVWKITFIYCQRSQKSFHIAFDRLEKILLNSSQQCGRSTMMVLGEAENMAAFLQENPESWMLNFSENLLDSKTKQIETLLIGAEGGFSDEERALMDAEKVLGLDTLLVLKSESAACVAAGKLLL
ncbi:MAG: 16S rRNA (uracil(1498)-N(3))-methyltransferase [Campylobacterota bacterium]|nr:16S rRNA (uracil(1498)-N(3))-methyltransferase [Campylobacterota bacterium]